MTEYMILVQRLESDLEDVGRLLLVNQGNSALECAYVRTLFSTLEGILYAFRQEVIEHRSFKDIFDVPAQAKIKEVRYHQPSNSLTSKIKRMNFKQSVKCSCRALAKVRGLDPKSLPFIGPDWENVLKANKIRDRLTHPKKIIDLELENESLEIIIKAKVWLKDIVFSHLVV